MATKIRLARRGRKKRPVYDIVVADARASRDGKFIEKIGLYNPNVSPKSFDLDSEKAFDWVMKGAQPTDTAKRLLSDKGVMYRKHLQLGVIKGAVKQEEADKKYEKWLADKNKSIEAKVDKINKDKAAADKARKDAESKIAKEKEEAQAKAQAEALAAAEAEAKAAEEAEAATEEAPAAEAAEAPAQEEPAAEAKEEAPAAEAKEETPAKEEAPAEEAPAEEASKEEPKAE